MTTRSGGEGTCLKDFVFQKVAVEDEDEFVGEHGHQSINMSTTNITHTSHPTRLGLAALCDSEWMTDRISGMEEECDVWMEEKPDILPSTHTDISNPDHIDQDPLRIGMQRPQRRRLVRISQILHLD